MHAVLFLYREVVDQPIEDRIEPVRAKRRPPLPVVLTQEEVQRVLSEMKGTHLLMTRLLYGAGLRLMECVRLRKD
jgi:integrase